MTEPRGSRRRPLWGFLSAEAISFAGNKTTMLALPWLVYTTTGSATKMGLAAFVQTGCYVIVRALGAPLVDRLGRRRCAIGAGLVSGAIIGLIPVLWAVGALPWAALLSVLGPLGAVQSLSDSAKRLMIPDLVTEQIPLERVTSLYSTVERLSFVLGSPTAGFMILVFGPVNVFYVEAAACTLAGLLIWWLVPEFPRRSARTAALPGEPRSSTASPEERVPYLESIREGMRYLRGDRLLVAICLVLFCTNLFDQAMMAVYIPAWIKEVLDDPVALGTIAGAFGLGAVIGSLGYAWLALRMSRYVTFGVGLVVAGSAPLFVLSLSDSLLAVLAVSFVSGLASAPINPIISSAMFERVPQPMQARVFGFTSSLAWAGIPLGGLFGGVLVDSFGLRQGLFITAVIYFVITLAPLLIPAPWQGLNRREPALESTS